MRATILAAATRGRSGFGRPRRLGFWLGVVLMALSFGIYPVYPWVAFLPMSWLDKVGVAAGLAAISWSMFLVGSLFAGKEGLVYLKQRFSSLRV
jgi:hypothetical protein